MMTDGPIPNRMAIASLSFLVSWEIWNERSAIVFRNKQAPRHLRNYKKFFSQDKKLSE
jgi:hypothetical protein